MRLPAERVPFPVAESYRVRPDLRRWGPDDRGHLRLDVRYPEYLREKLRLLGEDPGGCRVLAPDADPAGLRGALEAVAAGLAADLGPDLPAPIVLQPDRLRLPLLGLALERGSLELRQDRAPDLPSSTGPDAPALPATSLPTALRARAARHLAGLPPLERLADGLALALQEDLAVLRNDGRAELLHVCFPSSWDPAARAGASFAELHRPVPHNDALLAAAGPLVRAMLRKGPFVRYVWSLSPDGALDRNPRRRPAAPTAAGPADLWFRVERQTVMPLPAQDRALFTIRVYRAPLAAVAAAPARRRALAAALASMDEAVLAYKGVAGGRPALLAWLRRPGG